MLLGPLGSCIHGPKSLNAACGFLEGNLFLWLDPRAVCTSFPQGSLDNIGSGCKIPPLLHNNFFRTNESETPVVCTLFHSPFLSWTSLLIQVPKVGPLPLMGVVVRVQERKHPWLAHKPLQPGFICSCLTLPIFPGNWSHRPALPQLTRTQMLGRRGF